MQSKKSHQRKQLLAAAIASLGLSGLGVAQASGSLVVDLRAISITGVGGSIFGPKLADPGNYGNTVTLGVYARISGTNAVQHVYDVNEDGTLLVTTNDDTMQTLVGAFQSVGTLKGNMGNVASPGPNSQYNPSFQPFGGSGMTNGVFQDFDSDGDLDLGATGTDRTNMWAIRSDATVTAAVASDGTHGYYWEGVYHVQSQDTIIDPTTMELRIGTIRFIATSGGLSTNINFIVRQNGEAAALWFEDGIATGKNPTNAPFADGAPVTISFFPEPTAATLLGIASLGLLARRRCQT